MTLFYIRTFYYGILFLLENVIHNNPLFMGLEMEFVAFTALKVKS